MNLVISTLAALFASASAHAELHRLQCAFDSAPTATGLRLVLDTEARTMTHLFNGSGQPNPPMPMRESGDEWLGETVLPEDTPSMKAGTVLLSIAVDRYTLRFRMYNTMGALLFGGKTVTFGQCARLDRQL